MIYEIRPLTVADLPLIWSWLQEPHVQPWWRDAQEQYDLISGDLNDATMALHLVSADSIPFAYVQDYCVQDWMQEHLEDRPRRTRTIDTFIGDPAYLGKGHAAGFLRQHALWLLARGAPQVVIDPETENQVAIGAYKSAGFQEIGIRECDDGAHAICSLRLLHKTHERGLDRSFLRL